MDMPNITLTEQNNQVDFSNDAIDNSNKLLSIPGLDQTVALSVGNAIFLPRTSDDESGNYISCNVKIDGKDLIMMWLVERYIL